MLSVNAVLRLLLLALVCFATTALLMLVLNTLIGVVAGCYPINDCSRTPIIGTIGYFLDVCNHIVYFAIFPLGTVFVRRDFRKLSSKRIYRRIARIAFAAIPVFLLPLKYLLSIGLF